VKNVLTRLQTLEIVKIAIYPRHDLGMEDGSSMIVADAGCKMVGEPIVRTYCHIHQYGCNLSPNFACDITGGVTCTEIDRRQELNKIPCPIATQNKLIDQTCDFPMLRSLIPTDKSCNNEKGLMDLSLVGKSCADKNGNCIIRQIPGINFMSCCTKISHCGKRTFDYHEARDRIREYFSKIRK